MISGWHAYYQIFFDNAMIKLVFGSSFTYKDYNLKLFKNKHSMNVC
jgi:hypothetical protein